MIRAALITIMHIIIYAQSICIATNDEAIKMVLLRVEQTKKQQVQIKYVATTITAECTMQISTTTLQSRTANGSNDDNNKYIISIIMNQNNSVMAEKKRSKRNCNEVLPTEFVSGAIIACICIIGIKKEFCFGNSHLLIKVKL